MRILIISDTHDKTDNIEILKKKIGKIDLIIHCGDGTSDFDFASDFLKAKICGVRGNCDIISRESSILNLNIEGKLIHIEHGDKLPLYSELVLVQYAKDNGYDVILYGHTHVQKIINKDNVWIVNPGSLSRPHDGYPSYIIMQTDGKGNFEFNGERII